ncbi:Auxin-responsive protein SAUR40 [Glycine soja]
MAYKHLAVTVGEAKRRFVIRAGYLNHPLLQQLLDQYEGRYGFNKSGPLAIPCDEFLFEDIIQTLRDERWNFFL